MNACPYCEQAMPWPKPCRDVQIIAGLVADDFGVDATAVLGSSRAAEFSRPRQVAMYLAYELLELSYPEIGRAFGRHHSTILYGHGVVRELNRQSVFWRTRLRLIANEFEARVARLEASRGS